jgi:MFS family permease
VTGLPLYLAAAVLVRLPTEGARVALVLLALERTGGAAVGGALVAALLVPNVVAAPVVGLLVDRAARPRLLLAGAGLGLAASLAATAALLDRVPVALVVVVLLAAGCCGPALMGALSSRLSDLVAPDALPRAFGADSTTYNVAGIAGPSAAATAAGLLGATTATVLLAAVAAAGAALLTVLPLRPAPPVPPAPGALTGGLRAVARSRPLAAVTAASSAEQLGVGALPVVVALLAARAGTPAAAGWLLTALAVGALAGSLLWVWRPLPPQHAPAVVMVGACPALAGLLGGAVLLRARRPVPSLPRP